MAESDRFLALIKRNAKSSKGCDVVAVETINGVYNPATGSVGGTSTLTGTCRGLAVPYSMNSFDTEPVDGVTILKGDRKLIIAVDALLWTPSVLCKFTLYGAEWRVIGISDLMIGDTKIGYKVQIRK